MPLASVLPVFFALPQGASNDSESDGGGGTPITEEEAAQAGIPLTVLKNCIACDDFFKIADPCTNSDTISDLERIDCLLIPLFQHRGFAVSQQHDVCRSADFWLPCGGKAKAKHTVIGSKRIDECRGSGNRVRGRVGAGSRMRWSSEGFDTYTCTYVTCICASLAQIWAFANLNLFRVARAISHPYPLSDACFREGGFQEGVGIWERELGLGWKWNGVEPSECVLTPVSAEGWGVRERVWARIPEEKEALDVYSSLPNALALFIGACPRIMNHTSVSEERLQHALSDYWYPFLHFHLRFDGLGRGSGGSNISFSVIL
ncbi:hypothetical protein DFP72DRAFT_847624 [Ephemerocybe angulata]|uniref:Uncharacterized protein n=1 Tax=Ephemerocybe angulata TaxID=980116 RepID=A0A8H6HZU3_9AGAR|nr:hypothetical protein DFP72DRAFT_847624 [Tulosesus angulatus]